MISLRLQPAQWLSLHTVATLLAALAVGLAALERGTGPLVLFVSIGAVLALMLTPRFPTIAVVTFLLAAHALPRYGRDQQAIFELGLLNWIAALGLAGFLVWRALLWSRPPASRWPWSLWVMAAFVTWAAVSLTVDLLAHREMARSGWNHPAQLVQAAVLMVLGAYLLGKRPAAVGVGAVLCLIPIFRGLIQTDAGIYLDGDVAGLAVIALPFALLGWHAHKRWWSAALAMLLTLGLVRIIWVAQNRGAAVGVVLVLAALWLNSRHRLRWLVVVLFVLVGSVLQAPSSYLQRFSVLWDPDASHATASLDRATIEQRKRLWETAWAAVKLNPLLGAGPAQETRALANLTGKSSKLPTHNSFLSAAVETGLVGLALYAILFLGTIAQLQRLINREAQDWRRQQARMLQAALCGYIGIGLVLSRYNMQLAYLLVGWAAALHLSVALERRRVQAAAVAPVDRSAATAQAKPAPRQTLPTRAGQPSALAHAWLRFGLIGLMLFVAYGSLVPLNLSLLSPSAAVDGFLALPAPAFGTGDRSDWAVNFLLLVPVAFGWRHLVAARASRPQALLRSMMLAVGLLVFSVAIEFAQMFFPPRVPSLNDVAAQFAGTLVGLGLHMKFCLSFERWLQRFGPHAPQPSRLATVLAGYLFLMLVFSLMPLDLSISPVELYRKWRDGRVILIPFSEPVVDLPLWLYSLAVDVVVWLPVGLLWSLERRAQRPAAVVGQILLVAAVVELAQLLVLTRVTDVTDVLLAGVGGLLGAQAAIWYRQRTPLEPARLRQWARQLWWLWLATLLVLFWFPFDFSPSRLGSPAIKEVLLATPFQNYFSRSEFGALNEIVRKLSFYLPGGLLLCFASSWPPGKGLFARNALLALGLACVIEAGQLMLPGRVADLTDVMLGAAGGILGLRIGAWLMGPAR